MTPRPGDHGLRAIALFEAIKGVIAVLAWLALLDLLHHDVQSLANETIAWLGLAPQEHLSELLLHYAEQLPLVNLRRLGLLALAYAAIRWVEAWGLWHTRAWAQYLGAASGGLYIPFELYEWWQQPGWLTTGVVALNAAIVGYLLWHVRQQRHRAADTMSA